MIKFNKLKAAPDVMYNKYAFHAHTLYIVHFKKNNFYKIGVTGKDVEKRLANYPEYEIVKVWENLEGGIAESVERQVVGTYHNYTPQDWKFNRPGQTECFRIKDVQKIIRFVEERLEGGLVVFFISQLADGTFKSSLKTQEGDIKFQREVPFHIAVDLMSITKEIPNFMDVVSKVCRRIRK